MFPSYSFSLLIILLNLSIFSLSIVPPSNTFTYVNQGEFSPYTVEYLADYRVLNLATFPFQLCFYNTTQNAFILGLRMGNKRSESIMRWIWDANRGYPVRENATLTFGADGNLVLADADGTVAWQTKTAYKDVVGLDLLPNGNMVLYDSKGKYVWQSFDHPTDTLLVGQALRAKRGPTKLVSRLSITQPFNGPYSFVMEQGRYWAMNYQSKNAKSPLVYYRSFEFGNRRGALDTLVFYAELASGSNSAFDLGFRTNMSGSDSSGTSIMARPKYNSTYTMLRVDIDGNLRMYTYDEDVDWGAWEVTFALFDRDNRIIPNSECKLPSKCGSFGLCDVDQCVACPRPQGLLGWSKGCVPPILPPCDGGKNVDYYQVDGVDHFTSAYDNGIGPMGLGQCRDRCSKDCKCLGFFYRADTSNCLVVPELGTLIKVSNSSHAGYIKFSK